MRNWTWSLLLALAFAQQESRNNSVVNKSERPLVTYCELIENPDRYHDKVVRFKASVYCGWHACFFYDLACDEKDKRAYTVLSCDTDESCEKLQEALSQNMSYDFTRKRSELVAIGKFNGPEDYGPGYKGFRFQLEIKEIEKTFSIPEKTPWPK